jgi:acetyltransferase-like isoleucine patch superfamily enzyme
MTEPWASEQRFRAELRAILDRCVRLSSARAIEIHTDNAKLTVHPGTTAGEIEDLVNRARPGYVHILNLGRREDPTHVRWVGLRFSALRRFVNACVGFLCTLLPASLLKNRLYRALGMTIGANVEISQGAFLDPFCPRLITIGAGTLVGSCAKVFTHVYRGQGRMFFGPVRIGSDCVISGTSTVGPCLIEDNVTIFPGVITVPFLRRIKAGAMIGFGHQPDNVRDAIGDFPE